jgi:hypothetical protein
MISEYLTECSLGSINLLIMQRASETSHRIILASFVGAVISTLTLWNDNCLPTSTTVVRIFAYVHPSRHEGSHKPYGPGYEAKALAGVEVDLLSIVSSNSNFHESNTKDVLLMSSYSLLFFFLSVALGRLILTNMFVEEFAALAIQRGSRSKRSWVWALLRHCEFRAHSNTGLSSSPADRSQA